MISYPIFAQIRAERAAREMRGVVLPFQPPIQNEVAAENVRAAGATWGDLWGLLFNFWEDVCLDTIDVMHHTTLAALDGEVIDYRIICDARQERNREAVRRAEAEYYGKLIRDVLEH